MSVKKFKFVSPGIFIDEIDNSQLPRVPATLGPLVIGRAKRGPALRPVQVNSFSELQLPSVSIEELPNLLTVLSEITYSENLTSPTSIKSISSYTECEFPAARFSNF